MVEMVEYHDSTACQPRPEVLEGGTDSIIETGIHKNEFELEMGVLIEESVEVFCQIKHVNVNNVL